MVNTARRRIGEGAFEKVVLARRTRVRAARPFDAPAIHARLSARHPACIRFAFGRGGGAFLGATPEGLVRRSGPRIASGSLAGTAPRGGTPEEDRRIARALLESKKEQEEHAIVLRAIRESLAPMCREIRSPESPRLVRLENVQHLHTPVTGILKSPGSVLSLVEALHPTPAVGGWPRAGAMGAIRAFERAARGWYAGPVGWVDAAGNGEFAVGIRSARIRGGEADLFAGAGILRDSDPVAELRETRAKLRAVLDVLLEPR
jgi:menaquinone-specific isochorismate synthase